MVVLVTGATGFLGSHVAMALKSEGVVATGRNKRALARLATYGLRAVPIDLRAPIAQADRDRIGPVTAIVHCAGLSSPWGSPAAFHQANVAATHHLLDMASDMGVCRFVYISTASVYFRFADQDGLQEDQLPPRFVNAYAQTKRQAELAVLARAEVGPVVIRPRGIYGAGDNALLPRLMRVARRGPLPRFAEDGATDITHVDDVVAAILAALRSDVTGEVLNISGGVGLPLPQIIAAACTATNVPLRWRHLPFGPTLAATRMVEAAARILPGRPEPPVTAYALGLLRYRQTIDISKAARLLGWTPQISFEEGLDRSFADGKMREGVL
ncbi:NAD(P)-dependent oxidoreductase [Yoonia sp. BS5-3]|uniref:NAD-dependent epimerase/dehydratase family protein n=1 Tax=Yoonia phaeophyticola TaxID=3137369 RepID=A0ABZ2V0G2_9RHOB